MHFKGSLTDGELRRIVGLRGDRRFDTNRAFSSIPLPGLSIPLPSITISISCSECGNEGDMKNDLFVLQEEGI